MVDGLCDDWINDIHPAFNSDIYRYYEVVVWIRKSMMHSFETLRDE